MRYCITPCSQALGYQPPPFNATTFLLLCVDPVDLEALGLVEEERRVNASAEPAVEVGGVVCPDDEDVLVCGDRKVDKARVARVIERIDGFRAVNAGALEMARIVETLTVMLISIVVYTVIPVTTFWARFAVRIALLPVIAGLSYEIIRFAAKHRGSLFAAMTAPALLVGDYRAVVGTHRSVGWFLRDARSGRRPMPGPVLSGEDCVESPRPELAPRHPRCRQSTPTHLRVTLTTDNLRDKQGPGCG